MPDDRAPETPDTPKADKPKRRSPRRVNDGEKPRSFTLSCPKDATQTVVTIPGTGRRTITEGESLDVEMTTPQYKAFHQSERMVECVENTNK